MGIDHTTQDGRKKKLARDVIELARTNQTNNPVLGSILLARRVNAILGSSLLPWDINEMPDDLLDNILSIERVPAEVAKQKQLDKLRDEWRKTHAHYQ